jgi:SMI1-KNR4 cell-wall
MLSMKDTITTIIDKYLQQWVNKGLNILPIRTIESEMCDPEQDLTIEWKRWLPVKSKVTDTEIADIENDIGYKLPDSYKIFLKHKHFYELNIFDVSFSSHIINCWQNSLRKLIFEGYPRELLIDKGFVPFAMYSDWGLLCFNTAKKGKGNEYEIVLWDHDNWSKVEFKYENFITMIITLDAEDDKSNTIT